MSVLEIDIREDLLPRHGPVLNTIAQIGNRYGPGRWVIVGGMMVMIIGREYEARAPRAESTKDADILVDIVTHPSLLADITNFLLTSRGYQLVDPIGDSYKSARCSFALSGVSAMIDVLCPDDTPGDQLAVPDNNVASIAIPGGRRAIDTARPVSLYYSDESANAEVYVPTYGGAIAVKTAAAVDERTAAAERHLQDVGFLLSIENVDPNEARKDLTARDIEMLRQIESSLNNRRSPMWSQLDRAQRQTALAVYEILTR